MASLKTFLFIGVIINLALISLETNLKINPSLSQDFIVLNFVYVLNPAEVYRSILKSR